MPRRIAAECTCARCTRVWYADYDPKKEETETTSLELVVRGPGGLVRKISYDTLCDTCAQAVANLVDKIDKKTDKASPQRKARAKEEEQKTAPAPTPAPSVAAPVTPGPTSPGARHVGAAGPSGTGGASSPTQSRAPAPQSTALRTPSS